MALCQKLDSERKKNCGGQPGSRIQKGCLNARKGWVGPPGGASVSTSRGHPERKGKEWYFMVMDSIFLSIYVIEAVLKITAQGCQYFCECWNVLDFFIMVIAMLDFILLQLNRLSLARRSQNQNFFRIFKVFKGLRALRAIQVLRRLRFLTSLQEVAETLGRSLPSIAAILILMFTCLFLFSVVLRALFRFSDPKRFQNIFTTIFTLFTLLTLDDWSIIYLDSRAQGAWYIAPILMVYIIIQYFIFLNLVIAVLVDNFQTAWLKALEKNKHEKATRTKRLIDDPLMDLSKTESVDRVSELTKQKQRIEKKFGAMTDRQQELLFHYLQLVEAVEHHQQKFRSQASVIDEIVDTTFEVRQAGERGALRGDRQGTHGSQGHPCHPCRLEKMTSGSESWRHPPNLLESSLDSRAGPQQSFKTPIESVSS
ncbi:cation channel sperm-associated protein 1 isoform X3 [Erinaceus europaeus]|uniref:Cation channel sperm-associated protein 1 isoform X3 n=1 Tax=Erinaceus europaeus TaxID=9365 RepID=A0ABM3W5Y4_ERIEU|nr:cation channel sperm-associated protein 1 isoform X3 [Erinaceus europaeus]